MIRSVLNPSRWTLPGFLLTFCCSMAGQAPPSTIHQPAKARIYYTGDLFGYLRWPDKQSSLDLACPGDPLVANDAAQTFLLTLAAQADDKILVGMGDNFAPELFSRVVDVPQGAHNKDRYFWDYLSINPAWRSDDLADADEYAKVLRDIQEGNGRLPIDNVACFLSRAGYVAAVPGKQDFHFGPEHLRQVARFLASQDSATAVDLSLRRRAVTFPSGTVLDRNAGYGSATQFTNYKPELRSAELKIMLGEHNYV